MSGAGAHAGPNLARDRFATPGERNTTTATASSRARALRTPRGWDNPPVHRRIFGSAVGIVASVGMGACMVPLRPHISSATAALVLVVPVIGGVVLGGFVAGLVSVAAGFLVFDFLFLPPYGTLTVGQPQGWVALGVYAVVMVIVARVVASLGEARAASVSRARNARDLFELSELLLTPRSLDELGTATVDAARRMLGLRGTALLVAADGRLEVLAVSGAPIDDEILDRIRSTSPIPVALSTGMSREQIRTLALATSGRPVGLLVMSGALADDALRELLPTMANQLALSLERAQLYERALQAEVLEEVDRLRQGLVGAVSHDLRTPLATMKVASTTLLESGATLSDADTKELYGLIDVQTDRLTRLVSNLLDMTRLEAGVLRVHRAPWSALDVVAEAVAAVRPSLEGREVDVAIDEDLPMLDVDHVLIGQVLMNLLDNAHRHGPPGTAITVRGELRGRGTVALSVADCGAGVPSARRESVFESFVHFDTGGRAGLGLSIAKTFVEAHGGRIWVEDLRGGGARFVFTVPVAEDAVAPPGTGAGPGIEPAAPGAAGDPGRG